MREILFRGKRVDNGKWAYGYYAESRRSMNSKIKPHKAWIVESFASNGGWLTPMIRRAIYDETVGQYTGLKDKNGNKIFEGDVVKYKIIVLNHFGKMEYKETKSVVEYNAPCFSPFETDLYEDYVMPEEAEVIGNVYDNQEILKGEREKI